MLVIFGMANIAGAYYVTNDKGDWVDHVNALGLSYLTEDFNDGSLNSGINSIVSTNGSIGGGVWNDQVKKDVATTTFNFDPNILAFGGNWDLSPLGPGTGIAVSADGNSIGEIPNTNTGEFWGFVADGDPSFSSVLLQAGSGTASPFNQETFKLEDMVYSTSKVPEPATLLLFGAGLLGLGLARKFKQ